MVGLVCGCKICPQSAWSETGRSEVGRNTARQLGTVNYSNARAIINGDASFPVPDGYDGTVGEYFTERGAQFEALMVDAYDK